ncbi:MAG: DsbA family protein [Patescibacteria group bacterium]
MEEKKFGIPQAIVLAGIIIAIAILLTGFKGQIPAKIKAPSIELKDISVEPITPKDHVLGDLNGAKVAIIEFSDTECPFCKRFHPTLQKIIGDSKGEVVWIYRHFPIEQLHSKAKKESEATECAAELGGNDAFWAYLNRLLEITPSNDGLDPAELPKIAKETGLDVAKFNTCLSSGKYKNLVEAQYKDGVKAGVTGTPSSILINLKNGKKTFLEGAQSYENVRDAVDSIK